MRPCVRLRVRDVEFEVAGAGASAGAGAGAGAGAEGTAAPAAPDAVAVVPRRVVAGLVLHIAGSKWCNRVHRHHRGNHVAFDVDVEAGVARQFCFDGDCRGWRSPPVRVPTAALPDQVPPGARLRLLPARER